MRRHGADLILNAQVTPPVGVWHLHPQKYPQGVRGMVQVVVSKETALRVAATGLPYGAEVVHQGKVRWDLALRCLNPQSVELIGRPYSRRKARDINVGPLSQGFDGWSMFVDMTVRCRKCAPCRHLRAAMWRYRAEEETRNAVRTWFGTLTVAPDERFKLLTQARAFAQRQGDDYDALDAATQWRYLTKYLHREITLFLKRLRKSSKSALRYLIVIEKHQDGFPHVHLLLHERDEIGVRHAALKRAWVLGFSDFKLIAKEDMHLEVTEAKFREVWYVCKYLSKSAESRIRASLRYGGALSIVVNRETVHNVKPVPEDREAPATYPTTPPPLTLGTPQQPPSVLSVKEGA